MCSGRSLGLKKNLPLNNWNIWDTLISKDSAFGKHKSILISSDQKDKTIQNCKRQVFFSLDISRFLQSC